MRSGGIAIVLALAACDEPTSAPPSPLPRRTPTTPGNTGSPPYSSPEDAGAPVLAYSVTAVAVNRDETCVTLSGAGLSRCWRGATPPVDAGALVFLSMRFDAAVGNGDWFLGRGGGSTYVWGSAALGTNGEPNADAAGTKITFGSEAYRSYRIAAAGSRHACAIGTSRELYCWGDDTFCQVSADERCAPQVRGMTDLTNILGPKRFISNVAAGASHTCVLGGVGSGADEKANASVYCWGANTHGQTGQPVQPITMPAPLPVVGLAETRITALASGDDHACAVTSGELYCWGKNDKLQASLDSAEPVVAPAKVELPDVVGKVTLLALGGDRTCFVVGPRTGMQPSRAFCLSGGRVREMRGFEDVLMLSVSDTHACAIARRQRSPTNARDLFCWAGDDPPERVNLAP